MSYKSSWTKNNPINITQRTSKYSPIKEAMQKINSGYDTKVYVVTCSDMKEARRIASAITQYRTRMNYKVRITRKGETIVLSRK